MQIRTIEVLRSEESSEKVSREKRRNNHEFAATINSTDFNNAKKRYLKWKHLLQTVKSKGKIQDALLHENLSARHEISKS